MAKYTKKDAKDVLRGILSYTSLAKKPKIVKPYGTYYSIMVGDEEIESNIRTLKRAKEIALIRARQEKATEILKVVAVVSWKKLRKEI
jgi:hypothetical protein